jgi:hypothetical protein
MTHDINKVQIKKELFTFNFEMTNLIIIVMFRKSDLKSELHFFAFLIAK